MAETATMHAAVIDGFGPPDVLHIAEMAVPVPAHGEVLVRVRAAGVNAIDWLSRAGTGVEVHGFPAVLGWDVSGTVVATGPEVTGLRAGAEVFGMLRFPALAGGYAEYVTAPADELSAKPDGIDHRCAAGAPMAGITAWQALFRHGKLSAGQRVLISGAAGGVGHVAVQLAKLAGAEVIATASARNHDFVTGLGADRVIDYSAERVEQAVSDVDLVMDSRGGEDFVRLLEVLRPGGMIVTLKGEAPDQAALARARSVRAGYVYVGPDAEALSSIARLLAEDRLRIAVERVFPLHDVVDAHKLGDGGHSRGRIVLDLM